jgi:hypothetical protein
MNSRPAIVSIEDSVGSDGTHVVVTLDWEDHAFTGEAVGPEDGRSRLAGEATLSAVSTILGSSTSLELLALATADLGTESVALAQVRLDNGDVLVGSALERDRDPRLAAARAVMDAINRRISPRLGGE